MGAKPKLGKNTPVIYLTPQGKLLTQSLVIQKIHTSPLLLLAGRYESIDERLIEAEVDEELSIGDYVVSGGEFKKLSKAGVRNPLFMLDEVDKMAMDFRGDHASALLEVFEGQVYTRHLGQA